MIKDKETRRIDTVVDWLRSIAESPLISMLRIMKGREPNLSARTPVGMTMTSRQRFGTLISSPASKIERLNSFLNTGTSAGCIRR
jgi:hypothetical protein